MSPSEAIERCKSGGLTDTWRENALEALVLAHNENVHSAMIAWLIRTKTIDMSLKETLLKTLAGNAALRWTSVDAECEWKSIDIVLTAQDEAKGTLFRVAIEHKLKSTEHSAQLEKYDEVLKSEYGSSTVYKTFLTCVGDHPISGNGWKRVTYSDLLPGLLQLATSRDPFALSYIELMRRLCTCQEVVRAEPEYARFVFSGEPRPELSLGFVRYISERRLRKLLQRSWLAGVAESVFITRKIPIEWKWVTDETNGKGLLNIQKHVKHAGRTLRTGLQLQDFTLKTFAAPFPYIKGAEARDKDAVKSYLDSHVRPCMKYAASKRASPIRKEGRGFSSFTYVKLAADNVERYKPDIWFGHITRALDLLM